jgi:hypothetical protein
VLLALVVLTIFLLSRRERWVRLLRKKPALGPAWLQLDSSKPLSRRRGRHQDVKLKFLEPLSMNYRDFGWGPVGASGKGVVPEVALRDQQGQWHEVVDSPYYLNEWLVYNSVGLDSAGPFVAVRLRAKEPLTLLEAFWHDYHPSSR